MIFLLRGTLFTVLLTFCSIYSFSQDLIITYKNDSVFCKIVEKKSDYIKFKTDTSENSSTSKINMQYVKKYYYNESQNNEYLKKINDDYNYKPFPFHLSFDIGYSYRLSKPPVSTDIELNNYYKDIKSGMGFCIDLSFCQNNSIGGGIKYSIHNSQANLSNMTVAMEDGSTLTGPASDDITIQSFGPYITSRNSLKNINGSYFLNFGGNVYIYKNKAWFINPFLLEGNAYGVVLEGGIDFNISQSAAIGFKLSMYTGVMKSFVFTANNYTETISLDKKDYDNLARIDLTVGIRFF